MVLFGVIPANLCSISDRALGFSFDVGAKLEFEISSRAHGRYLSLRVLSR